MKQYIPLMLAFFIVITTNLYLQFSGGAGTASNPYQITSHADMEALADSVTQGNNWSKGKYFKLLNDIGDSVRIAIGRTVNALYTGQLFQGNFDGNDNFDGQNNVRTDFKVNLENNVKWTRITGKVDIVNDDRLGKSNVNDTLFCSIENYKKAIPLNICHEGSNRFVKIADNSPSLSIKNNPVNDILESGKYSLEVVNITGWSVIMEEFAPSWRKKMEKMEKS